MEEKIKKSLIKCFLEYPRQTELRNLKQSFDSLEIGRNYVIILRFFDFAIFKDESLKAFLSDFFDKEAIDTIKQNLNEYQDGIDLKKMYCKNAIKKVVLEKAEIINKVEVLIFYIISESQKNDDSADY